MQLLPVYWDDGVSYVIWTLGVIFYSGAHKMSKTQNSLNV